MIDEFEIEEEKQSPFVKIVIGIVAIFSVILIVSYVIVDPRVLHIISGLVESEKLDLETLSIPITKEKTLTINEDAYEHLKRVYFDNLEHEFKVCLLGDITDTTYQVTEVYEPEIFSQSSSHVSAAACPRDTLVLLHTHPFKRCIASPQDIRNLEAFQEQNEEAIMAVMCEIDRFNLYG